VLYGAADQVGVVEFFSGAGIAFVVEDGEAGIGQV